MEEYSIVLIARERRDRLTRIFTFLTYSITLVIATLGVLSLWRRGVDDSIIVRVVATIFVAMTLPLSIHDINNHVLHFEQPLLQVYIIRIMFMIPIYSVTSLISLYDEDLNVYMECIRGLFEAYVIWNFTYFLMIYLAPTEESLAGHLRTQPQCHHLFPMNYIMRDWSMGTQFLLNCKLGTLQYVVWKIIVVIMTFIFQLFGVFGYGLWDFRYPYIYVTGITNFSQIIALYSLVLFYHATTDDLAAIHPLPKFLCIKSVVFFSFWQQSLISALVYFGIIHGSTYFSADVVGEALEDFIISIEMFLFAIAHHYVFSYRDFTERFASHYLSSPIRNRSRSGSSRGRALLEAAHPRDLVHDITSNLRRLSVGSWTETEETFGASAATSLVESERILLEEDLA